MFSRSSFSTLADGRRAVHLRIIETTDLHLHLLPYDYFTDRPWSGVGLAEAAALIEEIRAEAPNSMLFDNGDFLQGTPLGDYVARDRGLRDGDEHPIIAAMNALDYDAITLGNHEFNYGLPFLERTLAAARFPVVSANLATRLGAGARQDRTLVKPYALIDRIVTDDSGIGHPIRIGVIGFAPPQIVDWDQHALRGQLQSRDIVDAARAWVPEMREAGADVIIALAHTGIGTARHADGMENAAVPLARVDGIDALLTGHSHLLFPSPMFEGYSDIDVASGTIAGKPAVMGGCWGAHVGVIDMLLHRDGRAWHVLGTRSQVRPASNRNNAGTAQSVERAVAQAHAETLKAVRKPVGTSRVPLHSYFTHLAASDALRLVAEAQIAHVRAKLGPEVVGDMPILAAVAPFKAGGRSGPGGFTDVPEGPMALRHIADLYTFPNTIAALKLTGAEILEWLERAAAAYNRVRPGSIGTVLRNSDMPAYNFETIHPLDVEYDVSQPARYDVNGVLLDKAAHRVVSATLDGEPIDPDRHYILATNSYRAAGAGNFAGAESKNVILDSAVVVRDLVRDHVSASDAVAPRVGGSLRLKPLRDTFVLYETGPKAMTHLDELNRFRPEPRGTTRDGFLRLKLDLSQRL